LQSPSPSPTRSSARQARDVPAFRRGAGGDPDYQGRGVGSFVERNEAALVWYRRRSFYKLDAYKVESEPELLPPRKLPTRRTRDDETASLAGAATRRRRAPRKKPDGGTPPTS
jgi:hypothetical protein